jgi:hypothetical protein
MTAGDALHLVLTRGPRAPRLQALAVAPAALDTTALESLHRLAEDQTEDAVVRAGVIVHLARRGALAQAEAHPPPAVQSALLRAAEMLRTRAAIAGYEAGRAPEALPSPALAAAPADAPAINIVDLPPAEHRRIAAVSAPAATHVIGLRCGLREFALLAIPGQLDPPALLRAPARLGQVAVHHTAEYDSWTVPFEVLTRPDGDTIQIAVLDDRGRAHFAGQARMTGTGLHFTLHSVQKPGVAPVSVEGTVTKGGLAITGARSGGRTPPTRTPVRRA